MAIELKRHKKLIYYDDGTIFKQVKIKPEGPRPPHENYQHLNQIFSILEQDDVNFIPKIVNWGDDGFTYEYVHGITIMDELELKKRVYSQKEILEIKIAWDNIWKKLYQMSIDNLPDGDFLWHDDPHLSNMIWKNDTKELILLDINSFCISKYIPICYCYNKMFGILDELLRKQVMME